MIKEICITDESKSRMMLSRGMLDGMLSVQEERRTSKYYLIHSDNLLEGL